MYCIIGYWYKYTHATYDWFCGPRSHVLISNMHNKYSIYSKYSIYYQYWKQSNLHNKKTQKTITICNMKVQCI